MYAVLIIKFLILSNLHNMMVFKCGFEYAWNKFMFPLLLDRIYTTDTSCNLQICTRYYTHLSFYYPFGT